MVDFKETVSRIRGKWLRYAPDSWWGDEVDLRFYLAHKLKGIKNKKILDAGCNRGLILSEIGADNLKVGLDIVPEYFSVARKVNHSISLLAGDMTKMPIRDGSFDIVIVTNVLGVITSPAEKQLMVNEIHRVLKPRGVLFLVDLNGRYARNRDVPGRLKREELDGMLKQYFDYEIKGFNPLPPFPYFLPNRILAKVPGIWSILLYLMNNKIMINRSCFFYVEGAKR